MKKSNVSFWFLLAILSGYSCSLFAQTTTFLATGALQTYTVPPGVTCLLIDAAGASGGGNSEGITGPPYVIDSPGHGARVQATLTVIPGQVLNIYVGKGGATGVLFSASAGGYNGGGNSDFDPLSTIAGNAGGGGGGATDIRIGGLALGNRVLVAGGGGGAGANWSWGGPWPGTWNYDKGGDGGGTTAEDGWDDNIVGGLYAGLGGGLAGGLGGAAIFPTYGAGGNGVLGIGGVAGSGSAGGGGGGGYYGGGGGDYAGGGGGSSYTDPVLVTSFTHTRGYNNAADGYVTITVGGPPATGTIVGPTTICSGSTYTYTNTTAGGTISWTSSNPAIATIGSSSGIVTPVSPGVFNTVCTVTSGCGTSSTTLSVTVNPSPAAITGPGSVCVGNSITLSDLTLAGVWSSVSPLIGSVDPATGVVQGISSGTTTISYTVAGCPATTIVTVNPFPAPIGGPLTVCVGATVTLTDGSLGGSWSSTNPGVGTIGALSGVAGGISTGITDISYTLAGCAVGAELTVNPSPAAIVGPGSVCVGDSITLTDVTASGVWSSVTTAVGTIGPVSGVFYGLSNGTSTVSYTVSGCAATTIITVNPIPNAITGPLTICVGTSGTLSSTTPGGTWTSVQPAVGTIGAASGVIGGISVGTTTISYTAAGCSTTAIATINVTPTAILGPDSVCVGSFTTLSDAVSGGTWSSLSPTIGTVDGFGNVTGIATGNATIKYSIGTCFITVVVTVHPVPSAIVGPDSICVGSSVTYTDPIPGGVWSSLAPAFIPVTPAGVATALTVGGSTDIVYSISGCVVFKFVGVQDSARPITGAGQVCVGGSITLAEAALGGIWSTNPSTFASVSPSGFFGIVTALSAGVDTILYTKPYCPIQRHVVTVNPLPASISGTTAVCIGLGTTLSDATPGGLWSSSNPLATVSPTGVVTSTVVGLTDTIYYTLPTGCSTFAVVNVGTAPPGILPLHPSICQGAMDTLYDADPTHSGVWSSTSLAIAQVIDSSGVVTGISSGSVIISYTWPNGCYATDSFTVKPLIPASVTITGPTGLVCSGDSITFVAHPVNGGTPTYIWKKFSTIPFASTADTLKYPPTHGDVIMCYMTTHGICSVMDSVVDTFAVNVYPDSIAPVVTIMTAHSDSISYIGEIVTFNASVTWTGTITSYQWKVNNVAISGATNSSFALPVYSNDTVQCIVNGNPLCPASPLLPGVSNSIAIRAGYEAVGNVTQTMGSYTLFPNPNSGTFTLSGSVGNNSGLEVSYEISNVLGQVVYRGTAIPQNGMIREQVQLGNDAPGSYLLRVSNEAGSQTFHFVISK